MILNGLFGAAKARGDADQKSFHRLQAAPHAHDDGSRVPDESASLQTF
jgi:hypothetical protein